MSRFQSGQQTAHSGTDIKDTTKTKTELMPEAQPTEVKQNMLPLNYLLKKENSLHKTGTKPENRNVV